MESPITIRHLTTFEEFESLRDDWSKLLAMRKTSSAFLTWEWLTAWWKVNNAGRELWLLTAWSGKDLVGIAPLMLSNEKKHRLRFRLLQSIGALNTDESDFLVRDDDPAIIHSLLDFILQNRHRWDALMLHEFRVGQPSTRTIQEVLTQSRLRIRYKPSPHYHIPLASSWDEYFKSLSKNMRKNLERRLRRMKENHTLEIEHHRGSQIRREHFETIFEINRNGAFPEKYESESERAFHRELLHRMASQGWMEILFLKLDQEPVAFEYGFNVDGRFEDWRTGYNKDFRKQGIGKILLYFLLKEFSEKGYQDFDFLRGDYDHKHDWHPSKRDFAGIIAVNPLHLPGILALIVIPTIWHRVKYHLLPIMEKYRKTSNQREMKDNEQ